MTEIVFRECRYCRTRQRVELVTDGLGHLVERPLPCGCNERRLAGICLDCSSPVEGRPRVALRCAPCKTKARLEYTRRYREEHPERVARAQGKQNAKRRRQRRSQKHGDAMRARDREYRRKNRDKINENRRRRILKDAGAKKAEHRRRYKERHPDRVKEQQRRANAKRAAAKREYMHRYATRYVGEGKKPTCRKCGSEVSWSGLGRPRLDCPPCRGDVAELVARDEVRVA